MVDLITAEQLASIATSVGTIFLVFLFWKTIKQLGETVKLSKIQTNYRFRPWVGPSNSIRLMSTTTEGSQQFFITVKNYGELPASNVVAMSTLKTEMPNRDIIKKSTGVDTFSLGPLLPNMEKHYWFFVEPDLMQKAKDGNSQLFILLYFEYEFAGGKNGYGMISYFDPRSSGFIHKEMWVD